ncbi:MAG TPA: hypothetical protein VIQ31_39510 [Phormidium sp.]
MVVKIAETSQNPNPVMATLEMIGAGIPFAFLMEGFALGKNAQKIRLNFLELVVRALNFAVFIE